MRSSSFQCSQPIAADVEGFVNKFLEMFARVAPKNEQPCHDFFDSDCFSSSYK